MNALEIAQLYCDKELLERPTSLAGGNARGRQFLALLNEVLDDIYSRKAHADLVYSATAAVPPEGFDLSTLSPMTQLEDFRYILEGTMRTQGERESKWRQAGKDDAEQPFTSTAFPYSYRLRRGRLFLSQSTTVTFDYVSNLAVLQGSTVKKYFTADSDTSYIPRNVLRSGLEWRWREQAGLPYQTAFMTYELAYTEMVSAKAEAKTINSGDPCYPFPVGFGVVG